MIIIVHFLELKISWKWLYVCTCSLVTSSFFIKFHVAAPNLDVFLLTGSQVTQWNSGLLLHFSDTLVTWNSISEYPNCQICPPKKYQNFMVKKIFLYGCSKNPNYLVFGYPNQHYLTHTLIIQGIFERLVYIFPIQVVARNCKTAPAWRTSSRISRTSYIFFVKSFSYF